VNPYLALETPEDLDGWSALSALTEPGRLRDRARSVQASFGGGPLRAAASVDFLGVTSRVVSPVLAAIVAHGTAPALSLSTLWWRPAVPGPMRLASTAIGRADSLTDAVLAPVVVPLVAVYASTFSLSRKVLWGDVASALNGAALALGRGRPGFRRRSCCLLYRLPHGGTCGDCVLGP
jgi:hypothetical protein